MASALHESGSHPARNEIWLMPVCSVYWFDAENNHTSVTLYGKIYQFLLAFTGKRGIFESLYTVRVKSRTISKNNRKEFRHGTQRQQNRGESGICLRR